MQHAFSSSNSCCSSAFKAVRSNHVQCLTQMNKEDLEERDISGQTPLHVAAKLGLLQAIDLLQHEAPATQDAVSIFGENPALVAAGEGQTLSVQLLFNGNSKHTLARAQQRDINGTTVLMAAVARGNNDLALWLLKRFGKKLAMLPNNFRMLPLHVAAAKGNTEFIRNAIKYDRQMVNFRDQFGNVCNRRFFLDDFIKTGCTPVFYAIQGGCFNCVRLLVEKGDADICTVSDKGQSLLHVACLAGHAHIVRWIVNRSAANVILWTTKDNANAIHCASYSGSVAALYILLHTIPHKRRRQILALRDSRGNTALHLTAINNHTDAAQYLLENGAEPLLLNNGGQTAEAIAYVRKNYQLAKLLSYWKERKQKKTNIWSPSLVATNAELMNYIYTPNYWSTASHIMPNSSTCIAPMNTVTPSLSLQNNALKYSPKENFTSCNPVEVIESELRPITYVASDEGGRIYEDQSIQTDRDSLLTATKVLDEDEWRESLAAVAQIDKVLQEIDA
uniref:ANK_REP_REGION domain-containing protein n=1 Tax=Setaria digitata TaxID=48799 RepID=A0A915PU10_9BILA